MRSVFVRVLRRPPYHGDRIERAFGRLGYRATMRPEPAAGNVMVTWNRYPRDENFASAYERSGGHVVVVENGYFGRNWRGAEWYALSLDQHNGAGRLPRPSADRWQSFGIDLRPWRKRGEEVVILATRGMGSARVREPSGWAAAQLKSLSKSSAVPVRVRAHPGPQAQCLTDDLVADLSRAWAAVTWGSGAGIKAILAGVPVFHGLEGWIGSPAARMIDAGFGEPFTGDRLSMCHRLASAMWSIDEIEDGIALEWLMSASTT